MAAKGNAFITNLLGLIFNATPIANLADNAGTGPLTVLYLSLHTSSPGASGNQLTNECAYTSYTRVTVARSAGGWTVSGQSVSPVGTITFPTCTGTTETATHAAIGKATTGNAGQILWFGAISPTIAISTGVAPKLTTASVVTES